MAIKYVPYFKEPIQGQAILDNFIRTKRVLKYAENDKVLNRIERGMPLYEVETEEVVGSNKTENMVIRGECVSACAYLKENNIKVDLVYIDRLCKNNICKKKSKSSGGSGKSRRKVR